MSAERWRSEQEFHDRQADERARVLSARDYVFSDESYLQHESWIAPAFDLLGDVAGRHVLDLGCGHGMASVVLARRGARVTACDLSLGYAREARIRADANDVRTGLLVCNGEQLPFADGVFDCIWGNAVLHHLDMRRGGEELYRVLAPAGRAVFCEPWAGNRWLNAARRWLPYPGKQRTIDEHPLTPCDLDRLRERFPRLRVRGFQLFSMLGRVLRNERAVRTLQWLDARVLRRLPHFERYCRYVVLVLSR